MKPVQQRILGNDDTGPDLIGDCLKCCVASILELDYELVPHFVGVYDNWYGKLEEWLRSNFALGLLGRSYEPCDAPSVAWAGWWIAKVESMVFRGGVHVIVMNSHEIAWDPSPYAFRGHGRFLGGYCFWVPEPWRHGKFL